MKTPLARLVNRSIEVAEQQLVAARRLDTEGLREATALRQDLLFELDVLGPTAEDVAADEELGPLLRRLQELDRRLDRLLRTVVGFVHEALGTQPHAVYASDGRLRRGR